MSAWGTFSELEQTSTEEPSHKSSGITNINEYQPDQLD